MTTVLVAERNQSVRALITEALESELLAAVQCEHTGTSGLRAIEEGYFDLAVIDVALPEGTGFELARSAANHNIPALHEPA
jgi:CheY-like chemotaxis protein